MVKATVSLMPEREDLKSVEGGFVVLRFMSYGEYLHRRDLAMGMSMQGDLGKGTPDKINIDAMQSAVTQYEFKVCIVDHNLEDENGIKLNLGTPEGFAKLDPRIGQEISDLIDDKNRWEDPKSDGPVQSGSGEGDSVSQDSEANSGVDTGSGSTESMSDVWSTSE